MDGTRIKALIVTLLLFGGIAYFFFGKGSFPEFSNLKHLFSKNNVEVKAHKKRIDTKRGTVIDNYKGVNVYYNGSVTKVSGRNTTQDGYNLGLRFQCVEFAKRFYYETKGHKMPDSYGHAKDFFDKGLNDGQLNRTRGMYQFRNGSNSRPEKDDLVIIGGTARNQFGHLFILTDVTKNDVSFIQQNPGPLNPSRGKYKLMEINGKWYIDHEAIVGWLRLS